MSLWCGCRVLKLESPTLDMFTAWFEGPVLTAKYKSVSVLLISWRDASLGWQTQRWLLCQCRDNTVPCSCVMSPRHNMFWGQACNPPQGLLNTHWRSLLGLGVVGTGSGGRELIVITQGQPHPKASPLRLCGTAWNLWILNLHNLDLGTVRIVAKGEGTMYEMN